MKNIIEYYYNIKIDKLSQEEENYSLISNNNNYILKPYEYDQNRINEQYKLNININNQIIIDNIIPNKYNNLITNINNQNYILIKKQNKITPSLRSITYFERINLPNIYTNLERNNWEILWSNMIDYYETQIGENSKKYPKIRETFDYYIGLTENAISYIVNTKNTREKEVSDQKVLSHNTILLPLEDPENIVLDHKARDVAEYIKESFYNNNQNIYLELEEYFRYNYYSQYGMQILIGRILYPSHYFNIYDKIISGKAKEEELGKIISQNKKYEIYIFSIYSYLRKYYDMPFPEWLSPH